jgi:hypothetical protein
MRRAAPESPAGRVSSGHSAVVLSKGQAVVAFRVGGMAEKFWTTEEVRKLTPAQRDALLRDRMVLDLDTADPELVAWARDSGRRLLEELGLLPTKQG